MISKEFRIAAVSQRIDFIENRNEIRDSLDQALISWLAKAGFLAFPVPNSPVDGDQIDIWVQAWLDNLSPDLVLLSGGNDLNEYTKRDKTEKFMLDWALDNSCPVLGICRGMQVIGKLAGGNLMPLEGHVGTKHQFSSLWPGQVNSYHRFGFCECPPNYEVLIWASDGSIEAIKHRELSWEGWMWHPERQEDYTLDLKRLSKLVSNE